MQYHLSNTCKLYIGEAAIQHLVYYILLSKQFKCMNDFNIKLGQLGS